MSDALESAFNELCAVCRPRPDQDEGMMEAGARRLWKVLGEYRESEALEALDAWPKASEWFPTERELRDVLDRLKIKSRVKGKTTQPNRYDFPIGMTKQFCDRVEVARGSAYVNSWLRGGVTAEFDKNSIYVTEAGHDRLWRDCEFLIRDCCIAIIINPGVGQLIIDYMKDNDIGQYEPKRSRR